MIEFKKAGLSNIKGKDSSYYSINIVDIIKTRNDFLNEFKPKIGN